jgi:hypothetical protein
MIKPPIAHGNNIVEYDSFYSFGWAVVGQAAKHVKAVTQSIIREGPRGIREAVLNDISRSTLSDQGHPVVW